MSVARFDYWHQGPSRDTEWMDRAACRDQPPEWFFPTGDPRKVQEFCRSCPVFIDCGLYAMAETYDGRPLQGIWGGMTQRQRTRANKIRRAS